MSRPRHYWYYQVQMMVKRYPFDEPYTYMEYRFTQAIKDALNETERLRNGKRRIYAISEIFFKKTMTVESISLSLFYGTRTVQQWLNDFVILVGEKVGY